MTETPSRAELDAMHRPELNTYAAERGIADPVGYRRKDDLIDAVLASVAETGPETTKPPTEGEDTPDGEPDTSGAPDDATDDDEPDVPEGMVLVLGTTADNRTALWEQHRDHPGGELYLRGGQRKAAAATPAVHRAAKAGRLRVIDGK